MRCMNPVYGLYGARRIAAFAESDTSVSMQKHMLAVLRMLQIVKQNPVETDKTAASDCILRAGGPK